MNSASVHVVSATKRDSEVAGSLAPSIECGPPSPRVTSSNLREKLTAMGPLFGRGSSLSAMGMITFAALCLGAVVCFALAASLSPSLFSSGGLVGGAVFLMALLGGVIFMAIPGLAVAAWREREVSWDLVIDLAPNLLLRAASIVGVMILSTTIASSLALLLPGTPLGALLVNMAGFTLAGLAAYFLVRNSDRLSDGGLLARCGSIVLAVELVGISSLVGLRIDGVDLFLMALAYGVFSLWWSIFVISALLWVATAAILRIATWRSR